MNSPVPRRARHDGWTPARQASFLAALAETRRVAVAATAAGLSASSAYRLRRHPAAIDFAAAWDAALAPVPVQRPGSSLVAALALRAERREGRGIVETRVRPPAAATVARILARALRWHEKLQIR